MSVMRSQTSNNLAKADLCAVWSAICAIGRSALSVIAGLPTVSGRARMCSGSPARGGACP